MPLPFDCGLAVCSLWIEHFHPHVFHVESTLFFYFRTIPYARLLLLCCVVLSSVFSLPPLFSVEYDRFLFASSWVPKPETFLARKNLCVCLNFS